MKLGICLAAWGLALSLPYAARAQSQPAEASERDRIESPSEDGPTESANTPSLLTNAEEPAGYRPLIEQAIHEYDASNFGEARALFRKAYEVFPNARALRGLGMVEFELRNYDASIRYLSDALFSKVKPLVGPLRAETELLLARARQYVG